MLALGPVFSSRAFLDDRTTEDLSASESTHKCAARMLLFGDCRQGPSWHSRILCLMPCFSSYSERFGTSLVLSVARIRTANTSSHHSTARSRSWPMPLRLRFLGIKSGFLSPRPPSPSRGDPCPFHPYLVRYCAVLSGMPLREGGANNVRLRKN